jgi:hypothetical protein
VPDDDEPVDFESCLSDVDMDDVHGDQVQPAIACCNEWEYIWCDQLVPVTLTEIPLPAHVAEAVRVNYQIGRDQWDSGGVASVTHYRVDGAREDDLVEVVTAVIDAGADGPGTLFDWCFQGDPDTQPTFATSQACAEHLVVEAVGSQLDQIDFGDDSGEEGAQYAAAIDTIFGYLRDTAGTTPIELTVSQNVWSVDVVTTIVIRPDLGAAVVVGYDYGA